MEVSPLTTSPAIEPEESSPTDATPGDDTKRYIRVINGKTYEFPPDFEEDTPLYRPHGKWAWTNGHDILSCDPGTRLGSGLEGTVNLKVGYIDDKEVIYISKLTSVWDNWKLFFSSLYLNASSQYLRPLQGDCVPWIIGVRHCVGGRIAIAQDLPHPTGWREADMFLDEHQKEAIIEAYQKLHDRGVLHGDVEYRHMLIGDDGKVTIIDFGFSRVVGPSEQARKASLEPCSLVALHDEMRKVKFMLDWKDSRAIEYRLAKLCAAREERDRAAEDAAAENQKDPFDVVDVPKEPMSEEEATALDGALRLCDLDDWSHGDTWTAKRYEVVRLNHHANIIKTDVPRPLIPAQAKTEEPIPVAVNKEATSPTASATATDAVSDPAESASGASARADVSTGKRPREEERPRVEGKITDVTTLGKHKFDVLIEPVKKRQRTSEALVDSPLDISTPSSSSSCHKQSLNPRDRRDRLRSKAPRSSSSRPPPASESDDEDEDGEIVPDPTPYQLSPETWALLRSEASKGWERFSVANARVKGLQSQMDLEKHKLEKCRSDLLRMLLMLPAEDRTTFWNSVGRPDIRLLLGLLPESQVPSKPARDLAAARAQLSQNRTGVRTIRDLHAHGIKNHPRLTAIKRSETRPRSPSKLNQAVGPSTPKLPSARPSKVPQASNASSSAELESQLSQWTQYSEILAQRAKLEEAKDRALMPPPPPPYMIRSSDAATNHREGSVSKAFTSASRCPTPRESQVARGASPRPGVSGANVGTPTKPVHQEWSPPEDLKDKGSSRSADITALPSTMLATKRKREVTAEDEEHCAEDRGEPIAKKPKGALCGLM